MSEITKLVQTEGSAMSDVLTAGGMMLLCALGSLVSAFAVGFFVAQIVAGLSMRLREVTLIDKIFAVCDYYLNIPELVMEIMSKDFYKEDYEDVTSKLITDAVSYEMVKKYYVDLVTELFRTDIICSL